MCPNSVEKTLGDDWSKLCHTSSGCSFRVVILLQGEPLCSSPWGCSALNSLLPPINSDRLPYSCYKLLHTFLPKLLMCSVVFMLLFVHLSTLTTIWGLQRTAGLILKLNYVQVKYLITRWCWTQHVALDFIKEYVTCSPKTFCLPYASRFCTVMCWSVS